MRKNNLSLYDLCQDCGTRCCVEPGPPIVFTREVRRIRAYLEANNLEDHLQKVEGKNYYIIPRNKKGCFYLSNGRCEIQDVKPLDCRAYPMGFTHKLKLGVSETCSAKHFLPNSFLKNAKIELSDLNNIEKRQEMEAATTYGYLFNKKPRVFGKEAIIDLYLCDTKLFNKKILGNFFVDICEKIDMKRHGKPYLWNGNGAPIHLRGISGFQFITTSNIVVHALNLLGSCYINIFSCKDFDADRAADFSKRFFKAGKMKKRIIERK